MQAEYCPPTLLVSTTRIHVLKSFMVEIAIGKGWMKSHNITPDYVWACCTQNQSLRLTTDQSTPLQRCKRCCSPITSDIEFRASKGSQFRPYQKPETSPDILFFRFDRCRSFCSSSRIHLGGSVMIGVDFVREGYTALSQQIDLVCKNRHAIREAEPENPLQLLLSAAAKQPVSGSSSPALPFPAAGPQTKGAPVPIPTASAAIPIQSPRIKHHRASPYIAKMSVNKPLTSSPSSPLAILSAAAAACQQVPSAPSPPAIASSPKSMESPSMASPMTGCPPPPALFAFPQQPKFQFGVSPQAQQTPFPIPQPQFQAPAPFFFQQQQQQQAQVLPSIGSLPDIPESPSFSRMGSSPLVGGSPSAALPPISAFLFYQQQQQQQFQNPAFL